MSIIMGGVIVAAFINAGLQVGDRLVQWARKRCAA